MSNRCRKANVLLVKAFWEISELSSSWHKCSGEVCLPLRQSLVILGWMEWASQLLVGALFFNSSPSGGGAAGDDEEGIGAFSQF